MSNKSPDGRHLPRNVRIVVIKARIEKIVTAAAPERGLEHPVPLDELYERRMLVIDTVIMATSREGRNGHHRNARTCPEEINRLDEPRVIVATAFVDSDKGRLTFKSIELVDEDVRIYLAWIIEIILLIHNFIGRVGRWGSPSHAPQGL